MASDLDAADRAIIAQLQEDGRRGYGRIGEVVGLSEGAVRQRVARLVRSDVIRIVAVTDPDQLGFRVRATVGLRVAGDPQPVVDRLAAVTEVDYVVSTAGRFDLLVEVQCADHDRLYGLLNELKATPGVHDAETFMYLKLHKQTYPWPPSA
jgi:Lrp/AsnC family transcriptional regulator, regulator for asnA, asnC and gidA